MRRPPPAASGRSPSGHLALASEQRTIGSWSHSPAGRTHLGKSSRTTFRGHYPRLGCVCAAHASPHTTSTSSAPSCAKLASLDAAPLQDMRWLRPVCVVGGDVSAVHSRSLRCDIPSRSEPVNSTSPMSPRTPSSSHSCAPTSQISPRAVSVVLMQLQRALSLI